MQIEKVVAITGASSGIGLAMAQLFLKRGFNVAVLVRNPKSFSCEPQALGRLLVIKGDVRSTEDLGHFYKAIHERWQRLDGVIANAGVAIPQEVGDVCESSFDATMDTNVKGVFFTVKLALPYLEAGAAIVLVSSIQAQRGAGAWTVYGASKAAVRSLGRSFAEALGGKGVRVNVLSPGVTDTPILNKFGFDAETLASVLDGVKAATPLQRLGTPIDIAEAAYFLLCEQSAFITGADLQVDGGLAQI